ncbi:hypothetical protein PR048_016222 [Dryococelus australis]|uniref:Uncharacterized protein n=1 Tax=Dryococelus australis TaxID=614101 RepID=A0ABQ9HJK3_9NEOP|nr:hypothetical protein PR048_016222 [Dryococelus australis]
MKNLALSPEKTKILLSINKHIQGVESGSPMPIPTYLGIYFYSKLNWLPQMRHLTARVHAAISVLNAVSHTSWGGDQNIWFFIYTSFIPPPMDYGSLFMRHVILHLSTTLQRCLGLVHSTSVGAMHVEAKILPYSLHQDYIASKYWIKSKKYTTHPCHQLLDSLALHPIEHIAQSTTDLPLCSKSL